MDRWRTVWFILACVSGLIVSTFFYLFFLNIVFYETSMATKKLINMVHVKCRSEFYPLVNKTVRRLQFLDSLVSWNVDWPEYEPKDFTAPFIAGKPWADLDISDANFTPIWNQLDGNVNRVSYMGEYIIKDKRPLNPLGRTGLCGRGVLGRWGPNHAADPIVTRWKRNGSCVALHPISGKKILQFVAIERRDSHEWAIPGGMVDPGEYIGATLKREFLEEAFSYFDNPDEKSEQINNFFGKGDIVYEGYVDDPRNTDNAWMETSAVNFHDTDGDVIGKFSLKAGDDALNVCWMDITKELCLYASHADFISKVAEKHNAHW